MLRISIPDTADEFKRKRFKAQNTATMRPYFNAVNIFLFCLCNGIADAILIPLPTTKAPDLPESQPQITQAPAPLLHRDAIQGRQDTSWNTCSGFSVLGLPEISAGVSCVAPYTCLVGVHSVSPYWGCLLPTTSVDWYTTCEPYNAAQSFYYSHIRYW
jgi:hypothetical protein